MKPRLKIALVCPYSWSRPGGVQTHIAGLARALRSSGHEVHILAPADGPVSEPDFIPLGRGFPIPDNGSIQRVALSPLAVFRTRRALKYGKYDLVHLHEPLIPAVCLTALLSVHGPLVGTFHMVGSAKWYRLFKPLVARAIRRLDARICVSEASREFVASVLPGDYMLIKHGIDTPPAGKHKRSGKRIVFIGRPEPRKGLDVLLEAFAGLPADTQLDLIGAGPQYKNLPERVRAHGRVSDAKRQKILDASSLLCAPSLKGESFGLVLLEGMASGLPVVASDIPGYRAVLPPQCGRLVPPGDVAALRLALLELLNNPGLCQKMGDAGRKTAKTYSWKVVLPEILRVYQQVL